MSLEQYKDSTRAELWEILQIQMQENQKLTAERDELAAAINKVKCTLVINLNRQHTVEAHLRRVDRCISVLNELSVDPHALLAKRDLEMQAKGVKELISSVGVCQGSKSVGCYLDYDMVIDELNKLTKQAEG